MYYFPRLIKKIRPVAKQKANIDRTSKLEGGTQFINSSIGKYSFCGYDCVIMNTEIGAFCSIASNVKIGLVGHPLDWVSTSCAFYKGRDSIKKKYAKLDYIECGRTVIGNDVWIAENVLIKSGVKISNGAVIGMGSVVTHDIGAYEIWAGNPARFIRKRFSDNIIKKLEESHWWELSDDKLDKITDSFNQPLKMLDSIKNI